MLLKVSLHKLGGGAGTFDVFSLAGCHGTLHSSFSALLRLVYTHPLRELRTGSLPLTTACIYLRLYESAGSHHDLSHSLPNRLQEHQASVVALVSTSHRLCYCSTCAPVTAGAPALLFYTSQSTKLPARSKISRQHLY